MYEENKVNVNLHVDAKTRDCIPFQKVYFYTCNSFKVIVETKLRNLHR